MGVSSTIFSFDSKKNIVDDTPKSYDISDAALLMAADGYGHAKVEGKSDGGILVIKTKDNQKSFQFDKTPDIEEFFTLVKSKFEAINSERDLQH